MRCLAHCCGKAVGVYDLLKMGLMLIISHIRPINEKVTVFGFSRGGAANAADLLHPLCWQSRDHEQSEETC